jgi:hypothetical protein
MLGIVVAIYFWGPKFWGLFVGIILCSFAGDFLNKLIEVILGEGPIRYGNIIVSISNMAVKSLVYSAAIYLGLNIHFQTRQKAGEI